MLNRITRTLYVCEKRTFPIFVLLTCSIVLVLSPLATSQIAAQNDVADPGVRGGNKGAGPPLAGLTKGQLDMFNEGREAFEEENFVSNPPDGGDTGLGPMFNSDSCVSCHKQPDDGGSSPPENPQVDVATKLGAANVVPWFISRNGPVREARFIKHADNTPDGGVHNLFVIAGRSDARGCNKGDLRQEDFSNKSNIIFRIPTPVFGAGLIEAIPDFVLLNNVASNGNQKASLGISGRVNRNDSTGTITRFGWKAQVVSLQMFAGEAYNVEQGVSNAVFPQERSEVPDCTSFNQTPEDNANFETGGVDDITLFASFMQFLAPPERGPITSSVNDGFNVFNSVGCNLCHTPTLQTGNSTVSALNNKSVPLFSDLALHNMGRGLADNIEQGRATGDEFRSAPLWGLGQRIFFLHDGRTTDLLVAITAHASDGSEANAVIQRFEALPSSSKQNLLQFLRSL